VSAHLYLALRSLCLWQNIRHLSNVFQGLLMAQPNEFSSATKVATLWLHESERVYGDRLVSSEDLNKYKVIASATAKKRFTGMNLGSL
jgi:dynein heavy chain, axonemal